MSLLAVLAERRRTSHPVVQKSFYRGKWVTAPELNRIWDEEEKSRLAREFRDHGPKIVASGGGGGGSLYAEVHRERDEINRRMRASLENAAMMGREYYSDIRFD